MSDELPPSKVVGLDGKPVAQQTEAIGTNPMELPLPPLLLGVNADALAAAERLLFDVKRGAVQGVAIATYEPNEGKPHDCCVEWCGPPLTLLAAVERMKHRINLFLDVRHTKALPDGG